MDCYNSLDGKGNAGELVISSRANPLFKSLFKLVHSSRERRKTGTTLLDGVHLITAYRKMIGAPEMLIATPAGLAHAEINAAFAHTENAKRVLFSEALFDELSPVETPSGILALISHCAIDTPKRAGVLLLEAIQDPGNLGAALRSAAAAGFTHALLSNTCADAWSPKTLRAGMGAHFVLAIEEHVDLAARMAEQQFRVFALSIHAEHNLFDTDLRGDVGLLFGNEGAGLSDQLETLADRRIFIPMRGDVESLNVAAAASICCFEKLRQERAAGVSKAGRS